MKIGLTGYNGFVGTIIRKNLEKDGYEVIEIRTDEENNDFRIDTLIHCARKHKNIIDKDGKLIEFPSKEQWLSEFKTDVYLSYKTSWAFVGRGLKNVIFISSIYGKIAPSIRDIPMNYLVSKAAEIHLAKCLANELSPNIRVNTIILGGVRSDRQEADQPDWFLDEYSKKTLLDQMVQEDEIYGAVKFLISDDSKGMTGSEIVIDGGYLAI